MLGNDGVVECIEPIALKGANGEELCVGYGTTTTFVGAGVWLHDDGYVLAVRGSDHWYYPMPTGEELRAFQSQGAIPDPLPPYSIPAWKYGVGYSLWILVAIAAAALSIGSARKKKRLRDDAAAPLSAGPPSLELPNDRVLADTARPMLQGNEQIDQQAYVFTEPQLMNGRIVPGEKAAYCVLTTQRVLFLRLAAGPGSEVLDVDALRRAAVTSVGCDDGLMQLHFDGGAEARLFLVRRRERGFSNQLRFIRDVPKVLRAAAPAHADVVSQLSRVEGSSPAGGP